MTKTWKDCNFYQEMYELRHTWLLMQCNPENIIFDGNCKGCPLLNECKEEDMKSYEDED